MKKLNKKWTNIIRIYLGDSWVKNEQAVLNSLIKQQDSPPISLQQAREQVERLSHQSQSAVKKGHSSDYLASLMANMHHIQPPQCPMANAQQIIKGDIAAEKVPNYRCFNDLS